jgi:DNA-directed RNA polymerase subunit M/transcription elongation factor TFIIS
MHFCTDCGNMYYIRLTDTNGIVHYCRNCGHEDDTVTIDAVVVSHTSLKSDKNHYAHAVNKYTKLDPTLPRISTTQPNTPTGLQLWAHLRKKKQQAVMPMRTTPSLAKSFICVTMTST